MVDSLLSRILKISFPKFEPTPWQNLRSGRYTSMPGTYQQNLRWRTNHRDLYLAAKQRNNQRRYQKKKEFVRDFKQTHPCACGELDVACLDFHHINPDSKKKFQNGKRQCVNEITSPYTLKKEIEKCICICSNCHRKGHAGRPRPEHIQYFTAFWNPPWCASFSCSAIPSRMFWRNHVADYVSYRGDSYF